MEWSSQELTRELKVYRLLLKVDVEKLFKVSLFFFNKTAAGAKRLLTRYFG